MNSLAQLSVVAALLLSVFACANEAAGPAGPAARGAPAAPAAPAAAPPAAAALPERTGVISRRGEPRTLVGTALKVGDAMPSFVVVDPKQQEVASSPYAGKNLVISVVPSLDTQVCEMQTGRMTSESENFPPNTELLTISRDLPFAQGRYLETHGATALGSDFKRGSFGEAFGVLVKESGLLARSLWLVDAEGKIAYSEIVAEQSSEPDYDAFNAALAKLTGTAPAAAAKPAGGVPPPATQPAAGGPSSQPAP